MNQLFSARVIVAICFPDPIGSKVKSAKCAIQTFTFSFSFFVFVFVLGFVSLMPISVEATTSRP